MNETTNKEPLAHIISYFLLALIIAIPLCFWLYNPKAVMKIMNFYAGVE